jgi:hypothetical protein
MSDTEILDWIVKNASKLGIKPDYQWGKIEKSGYADISENEYTDIRKKVTELASRP